MSKFRKSMVKKAQTFEEKRKPIILGKILILENTVL